jgi:hypothetical protein
MNNRWIAISDTHGDHLDAEAWAFVRQFIDDFQPDTRIHLGDVFDLRFLRSGCTDQERYEDVSADIEAGMNLIDEYRPTHLMFGNHDHRLVRAQKDGSGVVRQFCRDLHETIMKQLRLHRTEVYPYCSRRGVLHWNGMAMLHGYGHGQYAGRQHAQVYGDCLFGHVHRIDTGTAARIVDGVSVQATGRTIGCLCRLDMDYATHRLATLQWQHGFAFGTVDKGRVTVCQASRNPITGKWSLPYFEQPKKSKPVTKPSTRKTKPRSGSRRA